MAKSKILRFLHDEPISQSEDVSVEERQLTVSTTPSTEIKDVLPLLTINQVECVPAGDFFSIFAHITNESKREVTLMRARVLNVTRNMAETMGSGSSKRVLMYEGSLAAAVFDDEAELVYKAMDENAEKTFSAHYVVSGRQSAEGIYIASMELQLPIHEA